MNCFQSFQETSTQHNVFGKMNLVENPAQKLLFPTEYVF